MALDGAKYRSSRCRRRRFARHLAALAICPAAWLMLLMATSRAADHSAAAVDLVFEQNVSYRTPAIESCRFDIARPRRRAAGGRPLVVVIHGGGWCEGDKSSFATDAHGVPGNIVDLAKLGFVAATINYRLSGEAPFPAALDDCRQAIHCLREQADEYNVDRRRVGVFGNSAGGHLALLLALAGAKAAADSGAGERTDSPGIQAAISDSGPIDLVAQHEQDRLRGVIERFLGGPPTETRLADYRRASPSGLANAPGPPLLLIYGARDEQVDVRTADDFVAARARAGHPDVHYVRLATAGHCPYSLERVAALRPTVDDFFARTLGPLSPP